MTILVQAFYAVIIWFAFARLGLNDWLGWSLLVAAILQTIAIGVLLFKDLTE